MNSKLCKKIRKQSKVILVEWFKGLVSKDESKNINESNILFYLSPQTHLFANNQFKLSAYSFKWTVKKIKDLARKTDIDVTTVGLKDIEKNNS